MFPLPFRDFLTIAPRSDLRMNVFLLMTRLVPLADVDPVAVEALLDAAFGPDRHMRTAYRMREGVRAIAGLSFAAVDAEGLIGSLQSWPVALKGRDGALTPMTLVGPVAVKPNLQRGGVGKMLMTRLIDAAESLGHDALIMIGDPEYYERFFGFCAAATQDWVLPGPVERHRLLAKISRPGGVPTLGCVIADPAFATEALTA
jgi:predicted N-acetyltransferase YhbS